jgi:hypothetical protein
MSCSRLVALSLLPSAASARAAISTVVLALAVCCIIPGCGSTPPVDTPPKRDADASLTSLVSNPEDTLELPDPRSTLTDAEKERWARQAALDLEQVLSSAAQQSAAPAATQEPTTITNPTVTPDASTDAAASQVSSATTIDVAPTAVEVAPSPTSANTGLSALAAESPVNEASDGQSVQSTGSQASAATQQLTIVRSALCSKVEGFGRFKPMASNVFAAGRPIRVIVYTEVDGFASRPARSGDPVQASLPIEEQTTVELSQALKLFADADGVVAWQRPAQRAIETTASRRKDFFLVQIVELPATLTIGRYNLKINLTDSTSRMQAESVLPIVIVADPSASRVTR